MAGRSTYRSARRRLALVTCLLWLVGIELLPNLHLARHRADHTHAADGTVVDHGDHAHVAAAEPARRPRTPQLAFHGPSATDHTAAGVAHRAIALHAPPPPLLAPLPVARASWWQLARPIEFAPSGHAVRPSARGPPGSIA